MTFEEFIASTQKDFAPSSAFSSPLQALWYARKGDWEQSHKIAQDIHTSEGSWIHAYLHRVEGDLSNAQYWYSRAGKPASKASLDEEWQEITMTLLNS